MNYILQYIWIDSTGYHSKEFYPSTVEKAVTLANMIADSDLKDDSIDANMFELLVNNNGITEKWEGENGESFEVLF